MAKNQKVIAFVLGTLIVVCVAIIAFNMVSTPENSPEFPEGTFWICKDCGHKFNVSIKELGEHHEKHWGESYPCPECGGDNVDRAMRCPHCGEIFPMPPRNVEQITCPKCEKSIGPPGK